MNGEENECTRPVYHVLGQADPDTLCAILDPIAGYDVTKLGVSENKDWHRVFQITPCEHADTIGFPQGCSSYEDWEIYRDMIYDAVDNFLYECNLIARCQPYTIQDEQLIRTQLQYNRKFLMKQIGYSCKELRRLQKYCESEPDLAADYEELYDIAYKEWQAVRSAPIRVPDALMTIDFDFIF